MPESTDDPFFPFFSFFPQPGAMLLTNKTFYLLEPVRRRKNEPAHVNVKKEIGLPGWYKDVVRKNIIGSSDGVEKYLAELGAERACREGIADAHRRFNDEIRPYLADGVKVALLSALRWMPFLHIDNYTLGGAENEYGFGPVDIGTEITYDRGFGCSFSVFTVQRYKHPAIKNPNRKGAIPYSVEGRLELPDGINNALFAARSSLQNYPVTEAGK